MSSPIWRWRRLYSCFSTSPKLLLSYVKDRPGHDRRYALDCYKIENELGWKPEVYLGEGLAETIYWYTENAAWLGSVLAGEYRSYYDKYYVNRDSALTAIASNEQLPFLASFSHQQPQSPETAI